MTMTIPAIVAKVHRKEGSEDCVRLLTTSVNDDATTLIVLLEQRSN